MKLRFRRINMNHYEAVLSGGEKCAIQRTLANGRTLFRLTGPGLDALEETFSKAERRANSIYTPTPQKQPRLSREDIEDLVVAVSLRKEAAQDNDEMDDYRRWTRLQHKLQKLL